MALSSTSALISLARRAAQVSVVKNGLPVPAARMITRPSCKWFTARRRMNGSQTLCTVIALITRVSWPNFSIVSCKAKAFSTVASMPM